jgi:DNA-binding NarL/FixJ family response regulator
VNAAGAGDQRLRVMVVDDHELVRAGMRALLVLHADVEVVGEARDGAELLALLQTTAVDVVLCDLNMPRMDGIECLERMRAEHPGVRTVVLSMDESPEAVRLATRAGAAGYIVKHAATAELATAVRTVGGGGRYLSPSVARSLLQHKASGPHDLLTERQVEILGHIALGRSSRDIGVLLGLSPKTVDVHRARILERLELRDIAGLTRYAYKHRLVR